MKHGGFKVRPFVAKERGKTYVRFQVVGYLNGERVRRRFEKRAGAVFEKSRLEVLAANSATAQARVTRLNEAQLAEAEAAMARLGDRKLAEVLDWYFANYRPPAVPHPLAEAVAAFLAWKKPHVEAVHLIDVERKLALLQSWFPGAEVCQLTTEGIEAQLAARNWAPKTWNNVRGCFHDFFDYCRAEPRRWAAANPIAAILPRKVARGIPRIETAEKIAALFSHLETYTGGTRNPLPAGCLVPYFALATFAGLRPAVPRGEVWKIGQLPPEELARTVDPAVGVIRMSPALSKTDSVRQIRIRPNLAAWLRAYPLERYPIIVPNLQAMVTEIRKRFELSDDVLRHTWISMHVAAFKSLGEAALEAGNSESIIRRHYLNLASDSEADAFWRIAPGIA